MSTTTIPSPVSPAIDQAARVLREVTDAAWPESREAQAFIRMHRDALAAALDEHAGLLEACLTPLPGDEAAALEASEAQVSDCALALERCLAEYRRREAAREDAGALIAARQMAGVIGL